MAHVNNACVKKNLQPYILVSLNAIRRIINIFKKSYPSYAEPVAWLTVRFLCILHYRASVKLSQHLSNWLSPFAQFVDMISLESVAYSAHIRAKSISVFLMQFPIRNVSLGEKVRKSQLECWRLTCQFPSWWSPTPNLRIFSCILGNQTQDDLRVFVTCF